MSPMLIAVVLIIGGGLLAYIIYNRTEGEYPFTYWLSWAAAAGGLLVLIGASRPLRSPYLIWSSVLGMGLATTFLIGKTEDEYHPVAWAGMSILIANLVVVIAGAVLGSSMLASVLALVGAALFIAGFWLRGQERALYDAAYTGSGIVLVSALVMGTGLARTPLEHLNEVEISRFNDVLASANSNIAAYDEALRQAQQYRSRIGTEFANADAAYVAMTDEMFAAAAKHHAKAIELLEVAGQPVAPVAAYDAAFERQVVERTAQAERANSEARQALQRLGGVQQLFETLSEEWIKEYLWFEVDGYWTSEENDFASYNVCYYGERVSTRTNGDVLETIVSDPQDRGSGSSSSDVAGVDWKYFTVEDYRTFVNEGLVLAADREITTDEAAGIYLCGPNPQGGQYGALGEPPVVIEKGYGSLRRQVGDEGASFVGDTRYGSWCTVQADGTVAPVPQDQQPPADAQWCWYQKPGDSTAYYWERRGSPGSYIWIRSHRRCLYCTPQSTWGGLDLVPDRVMAQTNRTEGSSIRGPADQGGGPGSGK